ncbi:MAG: AAA family ATPase [Spirochaetes bacterium]|uniref:Chromosome partition protein Smc n=1 Tax=Candidatus Ornithospirochaeta stercoripullorum TaxID=2840899 RepID=A0A9D9DX11_9SPIO|nr:AAA family ATPase [Candidatus Ornithospirochaeta stercoripullorum]
MFLKSLDIYGFKSFADKTHIDFAGGITSLLGPNGCGKSNIVDSIKWVLGEKSTKSLRAGKMEDVIFNGTDTRKPMPFAEVELTIDNSEHQLPTDVAEVAIKRRYFRTGESEYFLNGQKCLRRNISELFYDTGVGKSAYSILEQGKIDQILSTKPEDRRYLFEEAAGISRYKDQCHKAELDLEKTKENIDDITRSFNEAKRACDRSRSQAEKAKKARDLETRAFDLDVRYNLARIRTYNLMKDQRAKWKANAESEIARLQELMATLGDEIEKEQGELKAKNEELYQAQLSINNTENDIKMASERIGIWTENFQDASIRLKSADERIANIQSAIDRLKNEAEMLEDSLSLKRDQADEELNQITAITKKQEEKKVRIQILEKETQEREERSTALDEEVLKLTEDLKSVIEELVSQVDEKTDTAFTAERRDKAEKAFLDKAEEVKGVVSNRIAFLQSLKSDALVSREIAEKDFKVYFSSIDELVALFRAYIDTIPPVVDALLSADGLIARKRDIEKREGEIRKEKEENRTKIQLCRDEITVLRSDVDSLSVTLDQQKEHYRNVLSNLEIAENSLTSVRSSIEEKENEKENALLGSEKDRNLVQEYNDRIKAENSNRIQLQNVLDEMNRAIGEKRSVVAELTEGLQKKRNDKEKAFSDLNEANRILSEQTANISSTDVLIENIIQSFFTKYSRNLGEFQKIIEEEDLPDDTLLMNELNEVNKEIEKLGTVNYLAEDDYNAAKEQYDFYAKHLEDLNKARIDLEKVLQEIQDRAKELFLETYNEISNNFQAMFTRLFGGGIAKLTLEDPENVLVSGIDIFAQPPGKKLVTLSLLSGGERSMTAVALLFATYQVKPSPFCILDELDAALDDKNIGYFLDVLQDFGKQSQFIIITHNKHTVTGSETLLGVTQMEAGVSTTVSYRLDRIAGQPVILNDDNAVVDFDNDGKARS